MIPLLFELNRIPPDLDMNRQTDNGHFPPSGLVRAGARLKHLSALF